MDCPIWHRLYYMSFAYWIKHRLGAQQIINYSSAATDSVVVGQFVSRVRLFCNPTDCSLPGSSVHGISQARILEWIAICFSKGSSRPRNRTQVSCIAGGFFTVEPPAEPLFRDQLFSKQGLNKKLLIHQP